MTVYLKDGLAKNTLVPDDYLWYQHSVKNFQLDFPGKHSATLQLLLMNHSFTYPPVYARYSFIQLSKLWQRGVNKIAARGFEPAFSQFSQPPPPTHLHSFNIKCYSMRATCNETTFRFQNITAFSQFKGIECGRFLL